MDVRSVERKLAAILSADVEGYSRLMGQDEVATVQTITAYREAIAWPWPGTPAGGGRAGRQRAGGVLERGGRGAVRGGHPARAQGRNAALPAFRQMRFRIGINLGDVIVEGVRLYGDGVNIAARMESLAAGGGICLSGTAYDQVEGKLPFGYDYLGEHAVVARCASTGSGSSPAPRPNRRAGARAAGAVT